MKFRKTALAIAVAGIAAAPMASQADVTLSGVIEIELWGSDNDTPEGTDGKEGDFRFRTGDVNMNIEAEQELNSGLTGYGNMRFDLDQFSNGKDSNVSVADPDSSANKQISVDSLYAGVKGDFGDVRIGEIPLAIEYGQKANDIFDIGDEISAGIGYEGNFGPVKLGVNHSPPINEDVDDPNQDVSFGVGIEFALAGFTVGAGVEDRNELQNAAIGAAYGFGGFDLAAHYWTREGATGPEDTNGIAVQGKYGIADWSLGLTYATSDGEGDNFPVETVLRLDADYDLGGGLELKNRINIGEVDDNVDATDITEYRIMLAKSF